MLGKPHPSGQRELFNVFLKDIINPQHELALLADKIDWEYFEKELSPYFSNTGRPSHPIRLMVSMLLLKRLFNISDEQLAEQWVMNPYMQYFSGMNTFQHRFPMDPSNLVHFRKRIGKEGIEKIFAYSVKMHGKQAQEKTIIADTTVQENNITYPTDAKLYKRGIDKLNDLFDKYNIPRRQSYRRISKQLLRESYNPNHPRRHKKAKKAIKKLHTLLGRMLREFYRNAPEDILKENNELLNIIEAVYTQTRYDKNKIYSYHKPYTACISKGKPHKKYEFGNKIGLSITAKSLIITSVRAFKGNPHDSKTIEPVLNGHIQYTGSVPEELIFDRGGRGKKQIRETKICIPGKPLKKDNAHQRRKKRKKFRRRAAIEPVIGHLKKDFRMIINHLWDEDSPIINAMLAATGWNLKKMMEKLKKEFFVSIFFRLIMDFFYQKFFTKNNKLDLKLSF